MHYLWRLLPTLRLADYGVLFPLWFSHKEMYIFSPLTITIIIWIGINEGFKSFIISQIFLAAIKWFLPHIIKSHIWGLQKDFHTIFKKFFGGSLCDLHHCTFAIIWIKSTINHNIAPLLYPIGVSVLIVIYLCVHWEVRSHTLYLLRVANINALPLAVLISSYSL